MLRKFSLSGDWSPLFERMAGWSKTGTNSWSDGVSTVEYQPKESGSPKVGFVREQDDRCESELEDGREDSIILPSGIEVTLARACSMSRSRSGSGFTMNHVAFHVSDLGQEKQCLESLLGSCTLLERDRTWDPVAKAWWPDVHLFRDPDFYITIRGDFEASATDHVGWMAESKEKIDQIGQILCELEWPVLFGPDLIDGSYLIHFRGPDSRVHDFFYPTPELSSLQPPTEAQ